MTIQLKTDTGLIRSLEHAFNDNFSFVRELAQNSRRAGATAIQIDYDQFKNTLTVIDNGRGIDDMQMLFTIGQSGWSSTTQQEENPYGLGFLAAIYAAEHVSIMSGHRLLEFDTEDLLSDKGFEVQETTGHINGTCITLTGLKNKDLKHSFQFKMEKWFAGFPIPILFNGEPLERPEARDQGRYVRVAEVGECRLSKALTTHQWGPRVEFNLRAYYQGFPVLDTAYGADDDTVTVVHLYQKYFTAKLPDRSSLKNPEESQEKIEGRVLDRVKDHLRGWALTQDMSTPHLFRVLKAHKLLDLYNGVDVLPAVTEVTGESELPQPGKPNTIRTPSLPRQLTRQDLEGKILWTEPAVYSGVPDNVLAHWQLLHQLTNLGKAVHIARSELDSGHWLWEREVVRLTSWKDPVGKVYISAEEADHIDTLDDVRIFNCLTVTLSGYNQVVDTDTLATRCGDALYIPASCSNWEWAAILLGDKDLAPELRRISQQARASTPEERLCLALNEVNTEGLEDGQYVIALINGEFAVEPY